MTGPLVVVVPGLGLTESAAPLADAVRSRGAECVVLDLPGYSHRRPARGALGRGPVPTPPTVADVGRAAAAWVRSHGPHHGGPVTLVGHSTGAQAALTAALVLQREPPDPPDRPDPPGVTSGPALVLVGPTFRPSHRRIPGLLLATPLAYRRESPSELRVLPEILRGGLDLVRFLRSGMQDRPEERLGRLRLPLTLAAGRADTYAPEPWLRELAARAVQSPAVRVVRTEGSHNAVFTHPHQMAQVVLAAHRLHG